MKPGAPIQPALPPPVIDERTVRVERAYLDYKYCTFFEAYTEDGRYRWYDCYSRKSGETYEVTPFNCTCWDYVVRCGPFGFVCKHVIMLELALEKGDVKRLPLPIPNRRAE